MSNETPNASSCCSTTAPEPEPEASSRCGGHATPATADNGRENLLNSDDMTVCLVMEGTPVSKTAAEAAGLYRDYEGARYWFCCGACGPLFDAAPAKYAARAAA